MNNQDIIVGVDFSDASKAAIKEAGHIATLRKSWLNIVHIIEGEFFEREVDEKFITTEKLKKQAEAALSKFTLETLDSPHPSMRFFVFIGHPYEELMNQAVSLKCDLIVLGSYGNRGKAGRVGTTATRFVRQAPLPVLLVREGQRSPYQDIVVCYDFSDTSQRALDYAAEVADVHGARLHLLHVHVIYPNPYAMAYGNIPMRTADYQDEEITEFNKKLEDAMSTVQEKYPDLDTKVTTLKGGSADIGIYDYLKDVNADLAVLGTRGRTGLRKLLLGTTAEHVIHKCPCSVLALKPEGFS